MKTKENLQQSNSNKELFFQKPLELDEARATIRHELLIDSDNQADSTNKLEEIIEKPIFLERIRNSKALRRALQIMILAFTLIKADPLVAGESGQLSDKDRIVNVDEKKRAELNRALIAEGEYVVPQDVMISYGEVVDPGMIGVPAGGYFKKDFLAIDDRRDDFQKKLERLGYSQEQAELYANSFESGNIVFNEAELSKEQFQSILKHERMHREIYNLPVDKKQVLDEARDAIIKDYRDKEQRWSAKQDSAFLLIKEGKLTQEEYLELSKAEIIKENPILLDKDGGTSGLMPVLRNSEEFYTYLAMEKFQPKVIDFLIKNYPEAYTIYLNLKEEIDLQIATQSLNK